MNGCSLTCSKQLSSNTLHFLTNQLDMPRFPIHLQSLMHSVTIPNTYLRFLRREVGSFASRVLTNPKSCITLSSWRRSSWPFRRNTNSCPLLPEKRINREKFTLTEQTLKSKHKDTEELRSLAIRLARLQEWKCYRSFTWHILKPTV